MFENVMKFYELKAKKSCNPYKQLLEMETFKF